MRQNQQNKQRMRGRSNRKAPNPLTRSFDSNGPDVKIRGTALHIAEKYTQLARDASSAGDRVMAENYLQHAEHYYRIIAAAQAAQQAALSGREDEDADEDFEPMGSDRFEPRQVDLKVPGPYESRQPDGRTERVEGGERAEGNRSERQEGRGDFRRDRRQRFDRFGRGERGDRTQEGRGERAAQPALVPTLADAPQPDVSFPEMARPLIAVERGEPAPSSERNEPQAEMLGEQGAVQATAPGMPIETPVPAEDEVVPRKRTVRRRTVAEDGASTVARARAPRRPRTATTAAATAEQGED